MALEAAAEVARSAGFAAHILGDALEGEAREVGNRLADMEGLIFFIKRFKFLRAIGFEFGLQSKACFT